MAPENSFQQLMQGLLNKEPAAAEELFQRYGPAIRRIARIRIINARLGHMVESSDIRQEVLKSFFARVADYDLGEEAQLRRLLEQMTRHKVEDHNRKQRAQCRDPRNEEKGTVAELCDPRSLNPADLVSRRELSEECWRQLSPAERLLYSMKEEGRTWEEIADEMESSPEALRKRYERALERVREELRRQEG